MRLAKSSEYWPMNIGNPNEFTILERAECVQRVTGSTSKNLLRTAASGRSQTAESGHRQRAATVGMGAKDRSGGRFADVAGLLQKGYDRRNNDRGLTRGLGTDRSPDVPAGF
jgi:hypothetical protein